VFVLDSERLVNRWFSQVSVHEEDALAEAAQCEREIRGAQRLAFGGNRAGNHHTVDAVFRLGMVQCRSEPAVLLDEHRIRLGVNYESRVREIEDCSGATRSARPAAVLAQVE
jgi:hypothetical protein